MDKKTYLLYCIDGFDKREKETDEMKNIKKIDVIARTEREAIHKARQVLKCGDYKVYAVYERYYVNT